MGCEDTSTGLIPINDLATGTYLTYQGGLYPGGSNTVPAGHAAQLATARDAIVRRDTAGNASANGKIVFLGLGMSNTNQELDQFTVIDTTKAAYVTVTNGAQANRDASYMAGSPPDDYYDVVETRLSNQGVTPEQVGCVWIKTAESGETGSFPTHAQTLQGYLKDIVQTIATTYVNCKLILFSSRVYGGYGSATSPEPWAYEGGFAVKWLIEAQINATDVDLAYGTVPVLNWGPYLWADGLTPRSDGLVWECGDFESDGIHPESGAEQKVAQMLLDYLETNAYTTWFEGNEPIQENTLTSLNSSTDATSYDTDSIEPTANALVIAFVSTRFTTTPNAPTLSGCGLTWVQIATVVYGGTSTRRVTAFRAQGASPSAGAVTIDFAGQTQLCCLASIMEFSGAATEGSNGSYAIAQSVTGTASGAGSLTLTLPSAGGSDSAVVAGFSNNTGATTTPDTGWTEIHDMGSATPVQQLETQYNLSYDGEGSGSTAPGTPDWGGIMFEIRTQPKISRPVRANRTVQIPIAQLRI